MMLSGGRPTNQLQSLSERYSVGVVPSFVLQGPPIKLDRVAFAYRRRGNYKDFVSVAGTT